MEFMIIQASVIVLLSISVHKTHAMIDEKYYELATYECKFTQTEPVYSIHGLIIFPHHYQEVCKKGGKQNRLKASPAANPGFAMYKLKLVDVDDEQPSYNLLPCDSDRGIFFMKRIAEGFEDRSFVMYLHAAAFTLGQTYHRGESSRQPAC